MANVEDAERCIDIAVAAISAGDKIKADRFLQKSLRLHATQRAEKLLLQLNKLAQASGGASQQQNDDSEDDDDENVPRGVNTLRDSVNSESFPSVGTGAVEADYTAKQAREVDRIIKAKKDFYQVLQVEQGEFALTEIKKSYRKLALIVHPDKNKAPHASEAFKVVGHAYTTLSDTTKKYHYDHLLNSGRLDEDDDMSSAAAAAAASRGGMHMHAHRCSAGSYPFGFDDFLFRMFFGFESSYMFQRRENSARTYVYTTTPTTKQPPNVNGVNTKRNVPAGVNTRSPKSSSGAGVKPGGSADSRGSRANRLRNLKKKLRDIVDLEKKVEAGGVKPNPDQEEKLKKKTQLMSEIQQLKSQKTGAH